MEASPFLLLEDILWMRGVAETRLRLLLRSPIADVTTRRRRPEGWCDDPCCVRVSVVGVRTCECDCLCVCEFVCECVCENTPPRHPTFIIMWCCCEQHR
jgi:hypothetical protein